MKGKKMQQQTPPPVEVLISFRIPEDLMRKLRIASATAGHSTVPKFLREMIRDAVDKH
jgi:plasmid stability protein